jgi:hypothetical protein
MEKEQELSFLEEVEATLNIHRNYLRQLALDIILLENKELNKSLFEYIQVMGEFELLGEMTALTMKLERQK